MIATEAAQWERDHLGTWQAAVRNWLLLATQLQAAEARLAELKQQRGPFPLPCDAHLAVLRIPWSTDPLQRPRDEAVAAGICTADELTEGRMAEFCKASPCNYDPVMPVPLGNSAARLRIDPRTATDLGHFLRALVGDSRSRAVMTAKASS